MGLGRFMGDSSTHMVCPFWGVVGLGVRRDQDRCGGGGGGRRGLGGLLELYMMDPYSNVGIPCIILCTACECHSLVSLLLHSAVTQPTFSQRIAAQP